MILKYLERWLGSWRSPYRGSFSKSYLHQAEEFAKRHKPQVLEKLGARVPSSILDVGCGAGGDLFRFVETIPSLKLIAGIDSNGPILEDARKKLSETQWSVDVKLNKSSVYEIPFDDATFDAVHAERLFLHLDEPLRALREMKRVLAPSGIIVITETDGASRSVDASDYETERRVIRFWTEARKNGLAGRQLNGWLEEAGFNSVETIPTAYSTTDYQLYRILSRSDVDDAQMRQRKYMPARALRKFNADLAQRAKQNRFFYSFNVVTVFAEKGS